MSDWNQDETPRDIPQPSEPGAAPETPPPADPPPVPDVPESPEDLDDDFDDEYDDDSSSLVVELRTFGRLVAAALRAASATPEAEMLRSEFRAGVSAMESEIKDSAVSSKEATQRVTSEYRETGSTRLRTDLAAALRAVNAAMVNLADSLEPTGEVVEVGEARQVDEQEPIVADAESVTESVEGEVGGGPVIDPSETPDC